MDPDYKAQVSQGEGPVREAEWLKSCEDHWRTLRLISSEDALKRNEKGKVVNKLK